MRQSHAQRTEQDSRLGLQSPAAGAGATDSPVPCQGVRNPGSQDHGKDGSFLGKCGLTTQQRPGQRKPYAR